MAAKLLSSSFFSVLPSFSPPFPSRKFPQWGLSRRPNIQQYGGPNYQRDQVKFQCFSHGALKSMAKFRKRQYVPLATSEDQLQYTEQTSDVPETVNYQTNSEDPSKASSSSIRFEGTDGKPGFISFYNCPYKTEDNVVVSEVQKNQGSVLWYIGPAVLVASFIFPSLYLRRIISAVFEDSLLTDFLILFFTEALFYCGVAVFLLLVDRLRGLEGNISAADSNRTQPSQFGQRISSVATLVLSLVIPMVTMGLVWPWTGPAASATLAPYLVGIVVQFAFERYAKYRNSPSLPVIPFIFQVYRLHQLNRAAQLVTALSFTVKGAETTAHNLAINKSLGTLLSVLQVLGIICIWSLSSFLMRLSPSTFDIRA